MKNQHKNSISEVQIQFADVLKEMKTSICIFFLFLSSWGWGQTMIIFRDFQIIEGGDTINRLIDNKREGNWITYPKPNYFACHGPTRYTIPYMTSIGDYHQDKKTGLWVYYDKEGHVVEVITYLQGLKQGASLSFFANGNVKSKRIWKNGILIEQFAYHKKGVRHFHSVHNGDTIEKFELYYKNGSIKYQGYHVQNWLIQSLEKFDLAGNSNISLHHEYAPLLLKNDLDFLLDN